jgi:hypothetical protein
MAAARRAARRGAATQLHGAATRCGGGVELEHGAIEGAGRPEPGPTGVHTVRM